MDGEQFFEKIDAVTRKMSRWMLCLLILLWIPSNKFIVNDLQCYSVLL